MATKKSTKTKAQKAHEKLVAEHEDRIMDMMSFWKTDTMSCVYPRTSHRKNYFMIDLDPDNKESELAKVEALHNVAKAVLNGELPEYVEAGGPKGWSSPKK